MQALLSWSLIPSDYARRRGRRGSDPLRQDSIMSSPRWCSMSCKGHIRVVVPRLSRRSCRRSRSPLSGTSGCRHSTGCSPFPSVHHRSVTVMFRVGQIRSQVRQWLHAPLHGAGRGYCRARLARVCVMRPPICRRTESVAFRHGLPSVPGLPLQQPGSGFLQQHTSPAGGGHPPSGQRGRYNSPA